MSDDPRVDAAKKALVELDAAADFNFQTPTFTAQARAVVAAIDAADAAAGIVRVKAECKNSHISAEPTIRWSPSLCVHPDQRASIQKSELARIGDALLVWVNEGDLCRYGEPVDQVAPPVDQVSPEPVAWRAESSDERLRSVTQPIYTNCWEDAVSMRQIGRIVTPLYAHLPDAPDDAMVEAGCVAKYSDKEWRWNGPLDDPVRESHQHWQGIERQKMRAILTAALKARTTP